MKRKVIDYNLNNTLSELEDLIMTWEEFEKMNQKEYYINDSKKKNNRY